MIERTEHLVSLLRLPESAAGMRIAHLTDLHRSRLTSDVRLRAAVDLANEAEPDIIVLTGDYVTRNKTDIKPCAEILAGLRAKTGIFAVLGNHDYSADAGEVERALGRVGIQLLLNRSETLKNGLHIVGLDEDRVERTDVAAAFEGIDNDELTITLAHNPALIEQVSDRNTLVLSGHTHGGQLQLPWVTSWAIRKIGAKHYHSGWYSLDKAKLYVNRGLGQVGVPFRFRSRPEVALFNLKQE